MVNGDNMPSKDFRIEKDSLGEVKVPASALYGAQTQRAVENFQISGLRPWRAFIWSIGSCQARRGPCELRAGIIQRARSGWKPRS
jgi:fumarate hydratase class II